MNKLTFRQYLDSKEQLLSAIANTPVSILEYEVRKYCSLPIGENEEEKVIVGLKPKHKIVVEWCYDNLTNPTPTSIQFDGPQDIVEDEKYNTFWTGTKLQKWLTRHTKKGANTW